jgi:glyoxylase-like metal-dependent hydrolase (beta-lactamase superfamily II)
MTTKVHHLNCATMAPALSLGGRLTPERMVAHVLLVEGERGLTLVDAGFGTEDIRTRRMGRPFIAMMGAALDPAETAVAQVRALGFDPADVRDVVLTHLDLDHAGGIGDFPQARVHVFADELAAATRRASVKEKNRYLPGQWAHGPLWAEHHASGEDWFGFSSVKVVGDDILMVPLVGHTRGHGGVGVRRPDGTWLLHAGDAYFNEGEKQTPPTCPSALTAFQGFVQMDKRARLENQERLRTLNADHADVTVFCAHDPAEFEALASG